MNHPELMAVPALMLADYALTILGAKKSATVYRNHFTTPSYELNPLWRSSVDQIRWFNPRHLALVTIFTALLILVDRTALLESQVFEFVLGMLFGAFGAVCGRHLANLMIFGYLNRNPQEISGQVQMSMKLVLKMSQYSYISLIPLFLIVAILAPSPHTGGVFLGLVGVVLAHFVWARKAE